MKQINILLIALMFLAACSSRNVKTVHTCKVKKGVFDIEIIETGEIAAVQSINISSPTMSWRYGMLKILKIVDDGSEVKKGDEAIVFDPSEVQKVIADAQADLEIAKAELQKTIAEQAQKTEELEADLKTAEITLEISKIELELSSYESEIKKKEIQLSLEKAKLDLDKAAQIIVNQKKINNEEINQVKLKIKQLENNLEEAKNTMKNLTVVSPSDGIALLRNNYSSGNKWKAGDQTWSGNALIDLPNMKTLKVITNINEVDISKIKLNQNVIIKLDAFADSSFKGKVITIASLAKTKEEKSKKIKVFPVEILIDGTSKLLTPGMTVNIKVSIQKVNDVIYVPLVALIKKDNKDYIFIKNGSGFDKHEVITGFANNDFVTIVNGVNVGEEVALSDPSEKKQEVKQKKNEKI